MSDRSEVRFGPLFSTGGDVQYPSDREPDTGPVAALPCPADDRDFADRQEQKSPKWHYIYFLLAAFDLVTVSASLYLNHQIMGICTGSVEVNRVWAERAAAYSHLGELAAHVNAPGNDVFDTHDVPNESKAMRVSHELRTPLNAIIGFSEVMQARMFGELNEKQADYIDDINSSGQHLLKFSLELAAWATSFWASHMTWSRSLS